MSGAPVIALRVFFGFIFEIEKNVGGNAGARFELALVPQSLGASASAMGDGSFLLPIFGAAEEGIRAMLKELISPQQSNLIVLLASIVLTLLGAGLGFWAARGRGLVAALAGPIVFGLWQFHQWITRYDPNTNYFGLDKLWVLGLEVGIFVALGVVMGLVWNRITAPKIQEK